jgi:hypothetical protein
MKKALFICCIVFISFIDINTAMAQTGEPYNSPVPVYTPIPPVLPPSPPIQDTLSIPAFSLPDQTIDYTAPPTPDNALEPATTPDNTLPQQPIKDTTGIAPFIPLIPPAMNTDTIPQR